MSVEFLCPNSWTDGELGILLLVAFLGGMVFAEILRDMSNG